MSEENPRAPLCKICGHRHFGVEHVWKGGASKRAEAITDRTEALRTKAAAKKKAKAKKKTKAKGKKR